MKKPFVKILSVALSLTFVMSLAACGDKGNGNRGNGGSDSAAEIREIGEYKGGLHVYNQSEVSGKWIVKDGKTDYKIVLPDSALQRVALARNDFKDLFLEATGAQILSEKENDITYSAEGKYIYIGCKNIEQAANLSLNAGLPNDKKINLEGFRIRTVGDGVFVSAQNEKGALWGTYELLSRLFNYERYWVDYYEIDKNVKNLPLYNFDIADNPDFETRIGPWGSVYTTSQATNANRMRFSLQHSDVYVGATKFHNTLEYLPPETYMAENPEWYAQQSSDPKPLVNVFQLCYTAHGDAEKYNAMVNAMAAACIKELEKDTVRPVITITQEDNTRYCTCPACEAGNRKYGGNSSGNMWVFQLDVVRKINEWLDVNQPGRKDTLLICMFAYQTYQQAPAYKDENGEWHPYDSKVDATNDPSVSNAAIFFAASTADYLRGLHRAEYNSKVHTAIEGWKKCTDNTGVWLYQTDFHDYLIPTDTFNYQQNYKLLMDFGAKWIFDQGQQGNQNSSGFNDFKLYLNSKLQWNVNLDVEQLKNKYFKAMYGPAADVMSDYYESIRIHMQQVGAKDIDSALSSADNFPYNTVKGWLDFAEKGYKALESIKESDPAYYKACYDHVCTESITARYLLIVYHEGSISPEQLIKEKASFKEDVIRLNFTEYIQHKDINDLIKDW